MRQYGLPHGCPYHPSTICGPETPSPAMTRPPPASASTVAAAIAAEAGGRAASCMMPVPRRMRLVSAARYASGVMASDPYASAVHTESKPSFSASRIFSTGSFSSAPEYPMLSPSFMGFLLNRSSESELHAGFRAQAFANLGIARGQPPSSESGVRDQQAVERIACPAQLERSLKPANRGRLIEDPPVVLDEILGRERRRRRGTKRRPCATEAQVHSPAASRSSENR